jgi:hypothetical protein
MNKPRPRRIVRRAVIALAGVVLAGLYVVWSATREPPEIQQSRGIRLGMTRPEVEAVMGFSETIGYTKANGEQGLMFGRSTQSNLMLMSKVKAWLGISNKGIPMDSWPVRCRLDKNGRVDLIERGDEVEDATQPQ